MDHHFSNSPMKASTRPFLQRVATRIHSATTAFSYNSKRQCNIPTQLAFVIAAQTSRTVGRVELSCTLLALGTSCSYTLSVIF